MLQSQTHWAGGFEQQRSRPPPAAETGRQGWGSAPLFQSPAKGLRKKWQAQLVRPAEQPSATATTAASGRSREELLGLRPAGCTCRPRHDAAAGSRDPGSFLLCAARVIHPRPPKRAKGCSKTTLVQTKIRVCAQKPAPGSCCSRPGAGFLCVKDSEKGKGGKGEFRFYAAFAGAKTSAFFRRACIERTMQLRVKLMIK